jgi:hypothetical protein
MHYRKYGCDSAPDLINLLFKSAAAAANELTAGKQGLSEEFCQLCSNACFVTPVLGKIRLRFQQMHYGAEVVLVREGPRAGGGGPS